MIRKNINDSDDFLNDNNEQLVNINLQEIEEDKKQNEQVIQFSQYQEADVIEFLNPFKQVSVSGPIKQNNDQSSGIKLYKIETYLKQYVEPFIVLRRYNDIYWLYLLLEQRYPSCIIPPIPPKLLNILYYDDSQEFKQRRQGIENFLKKLIQHRMICSSEDVKGFLIENEIEFERRKKEIEQKFPDLLQEQSYSQMALSALSSYFSKASQTLSSYVYNSNSQTPGNTIGIRKQSFGALQNEVEEEVSRFKDQEEFLLTLKESINQFQSEINKYTENTSQYSINYDSLSDNFQKLSQLKYSNIEQLQTISKQCSNQFNQSAKIKKEELERQNKELKEPLEEFRLMIDQALLACVRRQQQEIEKTKIILQTQSNFELEQKLLQLKKKEENMMKEVSQSAKILDDELIIFRKYKEEQMQLIMNSFVSILKHSSYQLQVQWQTFVLQNQNQEDNIDSSYFQKIQ